MAVLSTNAAQILFKMPRWFILGLLEYILTIVKEVFRFLIFAFSIGPTGGFENLQTHVQGDYHRSISFFFFFFFVFSDMV